MRYNTVMSEALRSAHLLSNIVENTAIEMTDDLYLKNCKPGDHFFYFCGPEADRVVFGKLGDSREVWPFEDSEDDETITLHTTWLWVEVGAPPRAVIRRIVNSHPVLLDPEFHLNALDLFDRTYFVACNDGRTRVTDEEANLIATKKYDEPFYIVRRENAQSLARFLRRVPALAIYNSTDSR